MFLNKRGYQNHMGRKDAYEKSKTLLLTDKSICPENRQLWKDFFELQERKLKRINNLARLDEAAYKTLIHYIGRFKNVNQWFHNKPWVSLTKEDIQRVYDNLEDGVIKNRFGKRYEDRKSYYTKVFKSKPFKMAGKLELAEEVFEFYRPQDNSDVNYIEYEDYMKLPVATKTLSQKLLLWLAWDIGENVGSLLQLKKRDFRRQINPHTQEPEYLVQLSKEILKRSRRPRIEITNYTETTQLLDIALHDKADDEPIFCFGHRQALKFMAHCVNASGVRCMPAGKKPTFKDLRSSMCCHLLKIGWRIEEVNSRLGHSPANLSMVTRYANYLALDRHTPKAKVSDNRIQALQDHLDRYQQQEKLHSHRIQEQNNRIVSLENKQEQVNDLITELIHKIQTLQAQLQQTQNRPQILSETRRQRVEI